MSGERIVISGGSGMLGNAVKRQYILRGSERLYAPTRQEVDITNKEALWAYLDSCNPDIIIHCAAYTDVEKCEIDCDTCFKVNVIGTQNLVDWIVLRSPKTRFVYISSTGIYGNYKNEPYNEFDSVIPLSVHHKTKKAGESIVVNHLQNYLIIRTGWLYGGSITQTKNFVYQRFLEGKRNSVIYSNCQQFGNPTYVENVAKQIITLLEHHHLGCYNCVDHAEYVSRYDYVSKIIEYFDLDCKVLPVHQKVFNRKAPVSHNEMAQNYKLKLHECDVMMPWDVSLKQYIDNLKREIGTI